MGAVILDAIRKKRADFPLLNKSAIERQVPGILRNYREIKERNYERSVIYRQVRRDDYHQPSFLESFFDFWASVSFRLVHRGRLLVAEVGSWEEWRRGFEPEPFTFRDFWQIEEVVNSLLSRVRRCHLTGDVYEERAVLLTIREHIDTMIKITGVGEVPADARAREAYVR